MNATQKSKNDFRNSKAWKSFRKEKKEEQKGLCFLSHKKLTGRWNLHHRLHSTKYAEEHYTDLSNKANFICLNKKQHELLHSLIYGYIHYGREEYFDRLLTAARFEIALNNL